jgi:hypothetical protein
MNDNFAPQMRLALVDMLERFRDRRPQHVLFTTFNFSSSFFENNVLPLLAGSMDEKFEAVATNQSTLNDALEEIKTVVVCDRSTLPEAKGDFRYALLPVGLDSGRFHPKVILMSGILADSGKNGLCLAVSSGNLTFSGWGINREVVGATAVASQHREPLRRLLNWILTQAQAQLEWIDRASSTDMVVEEEGGTRQILQALLSALNDVESQEESDDGCPSFHLVLPGEQSLLQELAGDKHWQTTTIISPFWAGVGDLIGGVRSDRFCFVPSIRSDGKYAFPIGALPPKNESFSFAKFKLGGERYTHAKALLFEREKERVFCIGSANFTGAAMGAAGSFENIEAMLRYSSSTFDPLNGVLVELDRGEIASEAFEEVEEGAPPLFPVVAEVFCDWKIRKLHCRLIIAASAGVLSEICLEVAGRRVPFEPGQLVQERAIDFSGNSPVRTFLLTYCSGQADKQNFRGLVIQLNAEDDELGYFPPPRLDRVLDYLRGLDPAAPGGKDKGKRQLEREAAEDDDDTYEPTFDFFSFFQGTYKLRHYYEKRADINPFDKSSPHGIPMLLRAVMLQPVIAPEAIIGRYVQLTEIRETIEWLEHQVKTGQQVSLRKEINEELKSLKGKIREQLRASPAFEAMFGAEAKEDNIEKFIKWFHSEIKQDAIISNR